MRSRGCRKKSLEQLIRWQQLHVRTSGRNFARASQAFLAKLNKADSSFPSVKKARTADDGGCVMWFQSLARDEICYM